MLPTSLQSQAMLLKKDHNYSDPSALCLKCVASEANLTVWHFRSAYSHCRNRQFCSYQATINQLMLKTQQ